MTKVDSTVLTWRTVESDVESVRSFTKNNLSGQDIFYLKSSGYGPIQQKNRTTFWTKYRSQKIPTTDRTKKIWTENPDHRKDYSQDGWTIHHKPGKHDRTCISRDETFVVENFRGYRIVLFFPSRVRYVFIRMR